MCCFDFIASAQSRLGSISDTTERMNRRHTAAEHTPLLNVGGDEGLSDKDWFHLGSSHISGKVLNVGTKNKKISLP